MKIIIIVLIAATASLGTFPYGYKFAHVLGIDNYYFTVILGLLFAMSATLANVALGVYSLLNLHHEPLGRKYFLILASLFSAIPNGFLCYFAYQTILSHPINLTLSVCVTLTNAGIGYTAVANLMSTLRNSHKTATQRYRIFGVLIGICVSTPILMASIHGLTIIFAKQSLNSEIAINVIGVFTWLPTAALFSHGTQHALMSAAKIRHFDKKHIALIVFSVLSGTAFAQIAIDFFNPAMAIPSILRLPSAQYLIYHFLIPLAFIASTSVNYFALKKISLVFMRGKHDNRDRKTTFR